MSRYNKIERSRNRIIKPMVEIEEARDKANMFRGTTAPLSDHALSLYLMWRFG